MEVIGNSDDALNEYLNSLSVDINEENDALDNMVDEAWDSRHEKE